MLAGVAEAPGASPPSRLLSLCLLFHNRQHRDHQHHYLVTLIISRSIGTKHNDDKTEAARPQALSIGRYLLTAK